MSSAVSSYANSRVIGRQQNIVKNNNRSLIGDSVGSGSGNTNANRFSTAPIKYENLSTRMERLKLQNQRGSVSCSKERRSGGVGIGGSVDRGILVGADGIKNKRDVRNYSPELMVGNLKSAVVIGGACGNDDTNKRGRYAVVGDLRPSTSNSTISRLNRNMRTQVSFEGEGGLLDGILGDRHAGRVKKNTGLKKYNQRMLKEIGNICSGSGGHNMRRVERNLGSGFKDVGYEHKSPLSRSHSRSPQCKDREAGLRQFDARKIAQGLWKGRQSVDSQNEPLQLRAQVQVQMSAQAEVHTEKENSHAVHLNEELLRQGKLIPGQIYSKEELELYFGQHRKC